MKKEKYPKFEKIDDHTIKIITEKANDIPLNAVIQNREQLLQQKAHIEQALKNIDEIIINAKKLGITPEKVDGHIKELKQEGEE